MNEAKDIVGLASARYSMIDFVQQTDPEVPHARSEITPIISGVN